MLKVGCEGLRFAQNDKHEIAIETLEIAVLAGQKHLPRLVSRVFRAH